MNKSVLGKKKQTEYFYDFDLIVNNLFFSFKMVSNIYVFGVYMVASISNKVLSTLVVYM